METEYLPCLELEPTQPARACVIFMHGLGADGHDFEGVLPQLGLPASLGVRFVLPHAPQRPVSLNGGMRMRAWYDLESLQLDHNEDAAGIRASAQQVQALIAREQARGIAPEKIVLAGFSQGGAMALYTGLRLPGPLAGVMGLSTYLTLADSLAAEARADTDLPLFMAHGTQDPVVPWAAAQASRARIEAQGYQVEWHAYDMPHSLCEPELHAMAAWLRRVLG